VRRTEGREGLTEVVVPAEPSAVASVDVHDNVGQVEVLERVRNTLAVAGGGVLAGLEVLVGDKVGQRVGLDDEGNGGVWVLLEDGNNGCCNLVLRIFQDVQCRDAYGQCTRTCRWQHRRQRVHRWRPWRRNHGREDRR
jgi:hypothetical protein